jgi:hypothetical protein
MGTQVYLYLLPPVTTTLLPVIGGIAAVVLSPVNLSSQSADKAQMRHDVELTLIKDFVLTLRIAEEPLGLATQL